MVALAPSLVQVVKVIGQFCIEVTNMFRLFRKKAMIYVFLSLAIAVAVLFTFVYVVYSKVLEEDFKDKQLQLVEQMTANVTNTFTQIEERAELFINKNEITEYFKTDRQPLEYKFKIDSIDFEQVGVFVSGTDDYISDWSGTDYFESFDVAKIKNIQEDKKWIVEYIESGNKNIQKLLYVRTIKDDTGSILGYVVFFVSPQQFKDVLNFGNGTEFNKANDSIFSRFNAVGLEISDEILEIGGEKIDSEDFKNVKAGEYRMVDNLTMYYKGDVNNTNTSVLIEQKSTYISGQLRIIRMFLIGTYIFMIIIIIISLSFLLRRVESSFYELYDKMNSYRS